MSGGLPVLVFVHGGAWTAGLGSKAIPMKLWYFMAKRNWVRAARAPGLAHSIRRWGLTEAVVVAVADCG